MSIASSIYKHTLDADTLKALKAVPGFSATMKAVMSVYNEKQVRILTMASDLKVTEQVLPEYYNMLPPICEKLGIEIPDLFIRFECEPTANTYGVEKPFIVLSSGMLETFSDDLIRTVLAHECGHIAADHIVYQTMGNLIFDGAAAALGSKDFAILPFRSAFYRWTRASDLTADRAAVLCDGHAESVKELCMRYAGCVSSLRPRVNMELFLQQAEEYRSIVDNSTWDKLMGMMVVARRQQPLHAVRAVFVDEWQHTDACKNALQYLADPDGEDTQIPLLQTENEYLRMDCQTLEETFRAMGFSQIEFERQTQWHTKARENQILRIAFDGIVGAQMCSWHKRTEKIVISYYLPLNPQEHLEQYPEDIQVPEASGFFVGKDYRFAIMKFEEAGFCNIVATELPDLRRNQLVKEVRNLGKSIFRGQSSDQKNDPSSKENMVAKIYIDQKDWFTKDAWFHKDVQVQIVYHTYAAT